MVKLKVDKLINTHYINNVKAHGGILMKRNYPEFLLEEFGNDLQDIFGSVEEQENKISLRSIAGSPKKVKELCDRLPNNGVLDVYEIFGKYHRPTYLEVAVHVLKMLHASKIFDTYKLPPISEPNGRVGGADMDWSKIYLRYPVQRSVKVWHVLADILIEWDADLNDPMYVRVLSDGTANCNDKQHGNFGRLIMGYENVVVEGITSDDESMDSNMYASRNIHNLESSWENNANVRVTRAMDYQKEGIPIKADDQTYFDFYEILEAEGCSWQESGLKKRPAVCQNGEKLFKDFDQYGDTIFTESVKLCRQIWPNGELTREFVWGCSELIKQLNDFGLTKPQIRDIKSAIKKALGATYVDDPKKVNRATGQGTLWGSCREFLNTLNNKGDDRDYRTTVGANYVIAAGLRDLILNYNAYVKSNSNITPLKTEVPVIKSADDIVLDIKLGYFADGWSPRGRPFYRDNLVMFDHTEIDFEDEDEQEAV